MSEEANTLSTLHGITNYTKNETLRKNVPPAYDNILPQCHPQLLSDRLENLIHDIFRNENATLKLNVSLFGVQQWQPLVSSPSTILKQLNRI